MPAKYAGEVNISLTDVVDDLTDLQDGDLPGYLREKEGIEKVEANLAAAIPTHAKAADISAESYAEFLKNGEKLARIRAKKLIIDKAAEVLKESEIFYEDLRERTINRWSGNIDTIARDTGDTTGVAAFGAMLDYRSQYAKKAAITRRKNDAEAKAKDKDEAEAIPKADVEPTKETTPK